MNARALLIAAAASLLAAFAIAAPPLAGSWNIAPSGSAASSGDLLFRVTPGNGDSVEISVPVRSGTNDVTVARNIRQAMGAQLPGTYKVELGEGANVLISDSRGRPSFSIELVASDVESLRVAVRNIEAAASPTVPPQSTPATTQPPPTPAQPGAATPPKQNPEEAMPPANAPPAGSRSDGNAPATTAPGEASQPSAPPPPGGTTPPPGAASSPAAPPNATPPPK